MRASPRLRENISKLCDRERNYESDSLQGEGIRIGSQCPKNVFQPASTILMNNNQYGPLNITMSTLRYYNPVKHSEICSPASVLCQIKSCLSINPHLFARQKVFVPQGIGQILYSNTLIDMPRLHGPKTIKFSTAIAKFRKGEGAYVISDPWAKHMSIERALSQSLCMHRSSSEVDHMQNSSNLDQMCGVWITTLSNMQTVLIAKVSCTSNSQGIQ